jgi:hypothetical protein
VSNLAKKTRKCPIVVWRINIGKEGEREIERVRERAIIGEMVLFFHFGTANASLESGGTK